MRSPLGLGPLTLSLLSALAGCGGTDDSAGRRTFEYPRDDELRLNQLQLVATHNSYHVAPEGITNPAWAYTHAPLDVQLSADGVRGVELDVHYDAEQRRFEVYHLAMLDEGTRCRLFIDCLRVLRRWSDAHPAHHTLFVHLEPKSFPPPEAPEPWFEALEGEITAVWPRGRLVTPDDVRGDAATLRDAVRERGWPTLGETRGKLLFYVDNDTAFRDAYTRGGEDVRGRLLFSDSSPSDPFAAIRILNDPTGDAQQISDAVDQNLIVRTRIDSEGSPLPAGDAATVERVTSTGAQLVTTDFPSADDGGNGYVFALPGGTPSRCNPRTAPADCRSEDIEDPAQL